MYAYLVHTQSSHRRARFMRDRRLRARSAVLSSKSTALPLRLPRDLLFLLVSLSVLLILLFWAPGLLQVKQSVPMAARWPQDFPTSKSTPSLVMPLNLVREQKFLSPARKPKRFVPDFSAGAPSCKSGSHAYVVVAGDTLSTLATRFGTTWTTLTSFNHLADPNLILVNQVICIPGVSAVSSPDNSTSPGLSSPTNQFVALARQDAINAGISPDYFVRQINQESGFNPNVVSWAGAVGIAQFMPGTAAGLGVNPWNPTEALQGAARLMASYVSQYGGNYAMALAAYNAGTDNVQYAVNSCGANWRNCLPAETQNYIALIVG